MTLDDLKSVIILDRELSRTRELLTCLDDRLKSLTIQLDGLPKQKRSGDSRLADLIAKKLDAENRVAELDLQLFDERITLTEKILSCQTLTPTQMQILSCRYVEILPFAEIAAALKFTESHIFTLHRKALKKLQTSTS